MLGRTTKPYGGRPERRLWNEPGTVEVHILSFPSEAAFQKHRSDPWRIAYAHLREASPAEVELLSLRDVP